MNKQDIKLFLKNNTDCIEDILDSLGCHKIKTYQKRITACLPDGDNPTSISINTTSDNLYSMIYTRNDFQKCGNNDYKDFFNVVQYLNDCTLNQAIYYICKICGLKYDGKIEEKKKSSFSALNLLTREKKNEIIEDEILDEYFTNRFVRETCKLFLDDNIYEDTQEKFGVSYDVIDDRVVFPIRDNKGNLISFKGRTCNKDYKFKGIPKYLYYYDCHAENYLYGWYENRKEIQESNELIVLEAEKSVMQCDSFGLNNAVALSKKTISDPQLKMLIKSGKDIVLAFDKGVFLDDIFIECRKLSKFVNVYYIYDYDDLLKDKESPSDQGLDTFIKLYKNYKFKFKEG